MWVQECRYAEKPISFVLANIKYILTDLGSLGSSYIFDVSPNLKSECLDSLRFVWDSEEVETASSSGLQKSSRKINFMQK